MIGLTHKFVVSRRDPEAQKRHPDCQHFVLDVDHDPHAKPALLAYAASCEIDEPKLAADLRKLVDPRAAEVERLLGRIVGGDYGQLCDHPADCSCTAAQAIRLLGDRS